MRFSGPHSGAISTHLVARSLQGQAREGYLGSNSGGLFKMSNSLFLRLAAAVGLALAGPVLSSPAAAQITTIDPNDAGEYEPAANPSAQTTPQQQRPIDNDWAVPPASEEYQPIGNVDPDFPAPAQTVPAQTTPPAPAVDAETRASAAVSDTVSQDNVLAAAEGVFGRGAEGLAGLIEDILRKQGEPTAYITGEEAGGAFVVGLRYGSGTLHHQREGDRDVYWTGPSLGFDFGADASKMFVLVYNLHDDEDIFTRFGAAEGNAYVLGGFTASYMRRGDIVLIPIRMGVGVRLGVNAGYMRFSKDQRWLPF